MCVAEVGMGLGWLADPNLKDFLSVLLRFLLLVFSASFSQPTIKVSLASHLSVYMKPLPAPALLYLYFQHPSGLRESAQRLSPAFSGVRCPFPDGSQGTVF